MARKTKTQAQAPEAQLSAEDLAALNVLEAEPITARMAEAAADEAQAQAEAEAPAPAAAPEATPEVAFMDLVTAVPAEDQKAMSTRVAEEFDARITHEHRMSPGNETIQGKLKGARAKMIQQLPATVLCAAHVDPGFINRSLSEGKRYNVYAFAKLTDLLEGVTTGVFKNAVNLAVMQSLFRMRANGIAFTGAIAQAAVSDKIRVEAAIAKILVRHTVSAATAPTQSSSTLNALQTLGVIENRGTQKHAVWQLTDAPVTQRIAEVLKAA